MHIISTVIPNFDLRFLFIIYQICSINKQLFSFVIERFSDLN